jgi:hypothetical protein
MYMFICVYLAVTNTDEYTYSKMIILYNWQ